MLQFASSLHQAAVEGDQNQKWTAGPHKSKTTQRSKCQVRKASKALTTVQPARPLQLKEASGKPKSQNQASSDGNTHKS